MRRIRNILVALFALFLLAWIPVTALRSGLYPGFSEGSRTGYVDVIQWGGRTPWTRSWEGELRLAGSRKVWRFSVQDPIVVARLQETQGRKVTLRYVEWLRSPWPLGTDHEIVHVDVPGR
jgi:hypothetical protein